MLLEAGKNLHPSVRPQLYQAMLLTEQHLLKKIFTLKKKKGTGKLSELQPLATAATFLRKQYCPGGMTWRWAPQTRYTFRRIQRIIMKDLKTTDSENYANEHAFMTSQYFYNDKRKNCFFIRKYSS